MPGFGSLMAGRKAGYFQAALMLSGLILTMIFGVRFIKWYLDNRASLQNDQEDPIATLAALWAAVRWPLLGFALFLVGWLWALVTSLQIIHAAKAAEIPPRLS